MSETDLEADESPSFREGFRKQHKVDISGGQKPKPIASKKVIYQISIKIKTKVLILGKDIKILI